MQFRQLGDSGLQVSVLSLGSNVFGQHETFTHYLDQEGTVEIVDRALDLGINFIDTADMYSRGVAETYLAKAIAGRRDRFVIASKVGVPVGEGPNQEGLSRGHIMDSIEGTLRRLNTDFVDLYYAHRADPSTPLEETLRAFEDLIRQGKVRYLGCSNFAGWQIAAARGVAEGRGYVPMVVSQSPYNLLDRLVETEIVPCCSYYGMSIIPYSPLAQGVLTGKYRRGGEIPPETRAWQNPSRFLARYMSDDNLAMVEKLDVWANNHGHRVSELAVAWLLSKPLVCSVVTAVTSAEQLKANVKATEWKLDPEQVKGVQDIVASAHQL